MKRFERDEQGSDRLREFHSKMWKALVPPSGECASVQGELVRAVERLTDEDVKAFAEARALLDDDKTLRVRIDELEWKVEEGDALTSEEKEELAALEEKHVGPDWESLLERAHRCVANWCIANPTIIDREGKALGDVRHVFDPPPPPPPCAVCKGRGWLPAKDASSFPEMCACKKTASPV